MTQSFPYLLTVTEETWSIVCVQSPEASVLLEVTVPAFAGGAISDKRSKASATNPVTPRGCLIMA
jgi:hypothetical protein